MDIIKETEKRRAECEEKLERHIHMSIGKNSLLLRRIQALEDAFTHQNNNVAGPHFAPGQEVHQDIKSGRHYYVNVSQSTSSWESPLVVSQRTDDEGGWRLDNESAPGLETQRTKEEEQVNAFEKVEESINRILQTIKNI